MQCCSGIGVLLAASLLFPDPVFAQTESPGSTFKRIRVGTNPVGKLIDVQIDPEEQAIALAPPEDSKLEIETPEDEIKSKLDILPAKPKDLSEWFWTGISPSLDDAAFDRMSRALVQLQDAPQGSYQPSAQQFQEIVNKYGKDILLATIGKNISPALVLAVIGVESSGRIDASSEAGAKGLMQLIPATAERFGVTDILDPKQNIEGGTAYLEFLLKEFSGDPLLALAGYNAGENAVKRHQSVPPYEETRKYVPKVVAAWQIARVLCTSPPVLVTEACVFKSQAGK